jgi:hypothetical protein
MEQVAVELRFEVAQALSFMSVKTSCFLGHVFQDLLPNRLGEVRGLQHTNKRCCSDARSFLLGLENKPRGAANEPKRGRLLT